MAYYYSAQTNSFYDTNIVAMESIPSDKVEIIESEYRSLLDAQNNGYIIVAGTGGKPSTLKQDCGTCSCTIHETEVATKDKLGHIKVDDEPTAGSNNAVSSDGIKTSLDALDEGVVHLDGAETIKGAKTLKEDLTTSKSNPKAILQDTGIKKGTPPTSDATSGIVSYDNAGRADANKMGSVELEYGSDGATVAGLKAFKPTSGSTESASIKVVYPASGEPYAEAPTPPSGDNSNKVATTEWVKTAAPVTSVNGKTGDVTVDDGVTSFNGEKGDISYTAPVTSVNGKTGAVTIDTGVTSFNGKTGAVTYTAPVTSVNGKTGAVTVPTPAEYVTQQGTNYRIWSSGKRECWGVISVSANEYGIQNLPITISKYSCMISFDSNSKDYTSGYPSYYIHEASSTYISVICNKGGYIYYHCISR